MESRQGKPNQPTADAPVIMCDEPGSFAHGVLHDRHPAIIDQVLDSFPYTPAQRARLQQLREEITEGTVGALDDAADDHQRWQEWGQPYLGRSWYDTPFLWAESYFYRKLLAAVRYFEDGPWHRIDPFGPIKDAELQASPVNDELAALDRVDGAGNDQLGNLLLRASLWGNRADLGFHLTHDKPAAEPSAALLVDDSHQLWDLLEVNRAGVVALIADNSGRELLPDLILIDHLLHTGLAAEVVLHVKPDPYYVSDATTADVIACLRRLTTASGQAAVHGQRLWHSLRSGRLTIATDAFWCAPLSFHHMPTQLADSLHRSTVTITKGDLNYRRLLGDQAWPVTTSFQDLSRYFPSPVVALRTLKSDVISGIDLATANALEKTDHTWRTSGTHALIQARP